MARHGELVLTRVASLGYVKKKGIPRPGLLCEHLKEGKRPGMTVAEFDRPLEMLKELVGGDDVPKEFLADIERHGFKEFLCDKCYEQERRATESPVMVRITKAGRNN